MTDEQHIQAAYDNFVNRDEFDYDNYEAIFKAAVKWRDENPVTGVKASNPARPVAEIQAEYQQICAQAGERQYQKAIIEAQLQQMNQRLMELGQEHNAAIANQPTKEQVETDGSRSQDAE
jgi:hypothetical protein